MPDLCENKLYVTGDDDAIYVFHQDIQAQYKQMRKQINADNTRCKGYCTYWNKQKGYGFIRNENDNDYHFECINNYGNIFVHCSDIHANGEKILGKNEYVEFNCITQRDGKKKAVNVTGPNGSYVRSNYGYDDMMDTHNVKIECSGLTFIQYDECTHNDKESQSKPDQIKKPIDCFGKSMIYRFTSLFGPPYKWVQCTAKNYSKFDISFKLFFQSENPESYGCIIYENGELLKEYCIDEYNLLQENVCEFDKLIRTELQSIFNDAVKEHLIEYNVCNNIENEILSFCPQYLGLSNYLMHLQFMKEWSGYVKHENYHTQADSLYFNLFNSLENKINMIFVKHEIEILNKWSIKYQFWDKKDGVFKQLFDTIVKEEVDDCRNNYD